MINSRPIFECSKCGFEADLTNVYYTGMSFQCPHCQQFHASVISKGRDMAVFIPIDNNVALQYDLNGEQAKWQIKKN